MTQDYAHLFSGDVDSFVPSPVRKIFADYDFSRIISFAGGYPSGDTFPTQRIARAVCEAFARSGTSVLQYGASEGLLYLRQLLGRRYDVPVENVRITTSSQQGIDIFTRITIDPGDTILVSEPTFLGAIQSFRSYRANIIGVPHSDDPETLARGFRDAALSAKAAASRVKFIYLIPDFSNPTGFTLSLQARKALLEVARALDILILEDAPYRELRYSGEDIPTMYSLDAQRVVHLGSFSKILAPGLRLGWMFGPQQVLSQVTACRQSVDLCPPMLDQHIAAALLEDGTIERNLITTRELYRTKRDNMIAALEANMPRGVKWNCPDGGLFLYLTLPEGIDTVQMYDRALRAGVAYVAGAFFHTDGKGAREMRLNFSFVSLEQAATGIRILSQVIEESLLQ